MDAKIEKLRRVVADGSHNAFPGLTRFKGALYLSWRRSSGHAMNDGEIRLKRSFDDGFVWKFVSRISELPAGNETSLLFDGEKLHAFIRNERGTLRMKHTEGDFTQWSDEEDFQVGLQGPMACEINGRRFLSGRFRGASPRLGTSFTDRTETRFRTYVYVPEIKLFIEYADFPSGFDCAYSESVRLDDRRMLTAYYSQHEYGGQENFRDMEAGSDIFLATVRTDLLPEWGRLTPGAMAYLDKMKVAYK